jgi:hypothetical protein
VLIRAVKRNITDEVRQMLRDGFELNPEMSKPPLYVAIKARNIDMVRLLLSEGAAVHAHKNNPRSLPVQMFHACELNYKDRNDRNVLLEMRRILIAYNLMQTPKNAVPFTPVEPRIECAASEGLFALLPDELLVMVFERLGVRGVSAVAGVGVRMRRWATDWMTSEGVLNRRPDSCVFDARKARMMVGTLGLHEIIRTLAKYRPVAHHPDGTNIGWSTNTWLCRFDY